MRKIWLQKPNSLEIWDLLPNDAYKRENACPFLGIKGMGYKQEVTQNQVNTEYFISKILTKNQPITGIMYFQDDEHIKAFQKFVGDFREQLILYYSPSGEYEPYDRISAPYYKKVTVSQLEKGELDEFGWYQISTTLSTQDDVWNRDVVYSMSLDTQRKYDINVYGDGITNVTLDEDKYEYQFGGFANVGDIEYFSFDGTNWVNNRHPVNINDFGIIVEGVVSVGDVIQITRNTTVLEPLVYPYHYKYFLSGRTVLGIDINNEGREVGCLIKIKNTSTENNIEAPVEWFIDREYVDYYGVKHENADVQRAKFVLDLSPQSELVVDSNPITQEAKVNYRDGTSQSVVDLQEPDWDYINFITIAHGKNRVVFYLENAENVSISFSYKEQKEII